MHSQLRAIKGNWGGRFGIDTRNLWIILSPDPVYNLDRECIHWVSSLTLILHLKLSQIGSTVFRESKAKHHSFVKGMCIHSIYSLNVIGYLLYCGSSTGHRITAKMNFFFLKGKNIV